MPIAPPIPRQIFKEPTFSGGNRTNNNISRQYRVHQRYVSVKQQPRSLQASVTQYPVPPTVTCCRCNTCSCTDATTIASVLPGGAWDGVLDSITGHSDPAPIPQQYTPRPSPAHSPGHQLSHLQSDVQPQYLYLTSPAINQRNCSDLTAHPFLSLQETSTPRQYGDYHMPASIQAAPSHGLGNAPPSGSVSPVDCLLPSITTMHNK